MMEPSEGLAGPVEIRRGSVVLRLPHPLIAAPMAGALDPPYRMVLHRLGCPLSYTEMISARAVHEGTLRTRKLFSWIPEQGLSGAQIFGSDPVYLSHAASEMEKEGHDVIDLNAGCPKRKVYRTGAGSAMLKDPANLLVCAGAILDAVKVPVGIKMRMGFHKYEEEVLRALVKDLEGMGLSYVCMHPRTMSQQYSGSVDRELISRMSRWTDAMLIASGDIRSPGDVASFLEMGASAVMVARGHLGDPTWMQRVISAMSGGIWQPRYPQTPDQVHHHLSLAAEQLENCFAWYGEDRGVVEFRPHLGWYVKRFRGRRDMRDRMYSMKSGRETRELLLEIDHVWSASIAHD